MPPVVHPEIGGIGTITLVIAGPAIWRIAQTPNIFRRGHMHIVGISQRPPLLRYVGHFSCTITPAFRFSQADIAPERCPLTMRHGIEARASHWA